MKIVRDNLTIRSAVQADAQQLTDWWNDGKVMAHAGFPNGLGQSLESTLAQIAENETYLSQRCIIEIDGQRVGETSFTIGDHLATIGIKICNFSYQDRGYGSQLVQMLIDYLFTDEDLNRAMKIDRILLDTDAQNHRAQHVYEKLGFRKTGSPPHTWQDQLQQWHTAIDYELTNQDYLARAANEK